MDSNRPGSPLSNLGKIANIEISLSYDAPMRKMTVHVLQAHGIPSRENGQQTHTQVLDLLLFFSNCMTNKKLNFYKISYGTIKQNYLYLKYKFTCISGSFADAAK